MDLPTGIQSRAPHLRQMRPVRLSFRPERMSQHDGLFAVRTR
jgi:hypothetical protein